MKELGFVAFEKLKHKARSKTAEISAIKQTSSPEQFKKIQRNDALGTTLKLKDYKVQLFAQTQVATCNNTAFKGNNLKSK